MWDRNKLRLKNRESWMLFSFIGIKKSYSSDPEFEINRKLTRDGGEGSSRTTTMTGNGELLIGFHGEELPGYHCPGYFFLHKMYYVLSALCVFPFQSFYFEVVLRDSLCNTSAMLLIFNLLGGCNYKIYNWLHNMTLLSDETHYLYYVIRWLHVINILH